jgi:quinol monooxygenase YgiN
VVAMSTFDNAVSIHPYFKIQPGQMETCKSFLSQFNEKVVSEDKCLYYNFTFNDDVLCCREAYQDADGVQAHLENCGALLGEFMSIVELTRIELHGPAEELEKLKAPLADMNPDYFVYECGIGR